MARRWRRLLAWGLFGLSAGGAAANPVEAGGIRAQWRHREDTVEFTVTAPTTGWVAIGFNEVDSIVGAELVMMRAEAGGVYASHRNVLGAGDPRPVEQLGRASAVLAAGGAIASGRATFRLRLHHDLGAPPSLAPGSELVLILAYSVSPDFDHHSRVRRHIRVRL